MEARIENPSTYHNVFFARDPIVIDALASELLHLNVIKLPGDLVGTIGMVVGDWVRVQYSGRNSFATSIKVDGTTSQNKPKTNTYLKFENHLTNCAVLFLLKRTSRKHSLSVDELGYLT